MRLERLALLLGMAAIVVSGCSAGRSISNPFSSGGSTRTASEEFDSYDSNPPFDSGEVVNEPSAPVPPPPVPPARGISFTRLISLATPIGHRRTVHNKDNCAADKGCVAPQGCAKEGCGNTAPTGQPDCCVTEKRNWFRWFCPPRRPSTNCTSEDGCVAETSCFIPKSACVPESPCVHEYAQPLICGGCKTKDNCGCATCIQNPRCQTQQCPESQGCCEPTYRPCFFCRLFGRKTYCSPRCECSDKTGCVAGCRTEGCNSGREGCGAQSCQTTPARACSPLAGPMQDPFIDTDVDPHAVNGQAPTPVPAAPKNLEPQKIEPTNVDPRQTQSVPTTPQPVAMMPQPGTQTGSQPWIEPAMWHRLNVPANRVTTVQPRPYNAWSAGWSQP